MSYSITIAGENEPVSIVASQEDSLLESMRSAGLPVRKACRNGVCAICRCRLVRGAVDYGAQKPVGLWDRDIAQGYILPCIARLQSDVTLDEMTLEQS